MVPLWLQHGQRKHGRYGAPDGKQICDSLVPKYAQISSEAPTAIAAGRRSAQRERGFSPQCWRGRYSKGEHASRLSDAGSVKFAVFVSDLDVVGDQDTAKEHSCPCVCGNQGGHCGQPTRYNSSISSCDGLYHPRRQSCQFCRKQCLEPSAEDTRHQNIPKRFIVMHRFEWRGHRSA